MPKAIRVREDNLEFIKGFARLVCNMNLDYIGDNMEYNAEDGFATYLITDGDPADNNVTFTEMTEPGFRQLWKFTQHENPNQFVPIERV